MDDQPWQKRARLAGLTQRMLANLLGVTETGVSGQLRGKWPTPKYVKAMILAWGIMDPSQREKLLKLLEEETE